MSNLTPEQVASVEECDNLTNGILNATQGMGVGIVVGACLNVLQAACEFIPAEDRKKVADRMRAAADEIDAMLLPGEFQH